MRPPQDRAEPANRPPGNERRGNQNRRESLPTLVLKWFFLASSLGLALSTVLGIYMAFKFNRSRALIWGLLFSGTAIPAALVVWMAAQ
jgi:hypothetical protein